MTPEMNRKFTWIAGVFAAVTTFSAVMAGDYRFAIYMMVGLVGLGGGLSLGLAIRRWRGDL